MIHLNIVCVCMKWAQRQLVVHHNSQPRTGWHTGQPHRGGTHHRRWWTEVWRRSVLAELHGVTCRTVQLPGSIPGLIGQNDTVAVHVADFKSVDTEMCSCSTQPFRRTFYMPRIHLTPKDAHTSMSQYQQTLVNCCTVDSIVQCLELGCSWCHR